MLQEIWTGKAFAKAKALARDMYSQGHAAVQPLLHKAWVAIEPNATKLYEQLKVYWDKLQIELNKDPYRAYVAKIQGAAHSAYDFAQGLRARAIDLWNSDEVRNVTSVMLCEICWKILNVLTHRGMNAGEQSESVCDCAKAIA